MNKVIKFILSVAAFTVGFFIVSALLNYNSPKPVDNTTIDYSEAILAKVKQDVAMEKINRDLDLIAIRDGFLEGCNEAQDGLELFCLCSYDSISNELGSDGIYNMAMDMELGKELKEPYVEATTNALWNCLDFIN